MAQEKSSTNPDKLSGKKHGLVIIDTGASHHMTGNLSCLTDIIETMPCSVGYADGSTTFSQSKCIFKLTDRISLYDVLFCAELELFINLSFEAT